MVDVASLPGRVLLPTRLVIVIIIISTSIDQQQQQSVSSRSAMVADGDLATVILRRKPEKKSIGCDKVITIVELPE